MIKTINMFRTFNKAYCLPLSDEDFTWKESIEALGELSKEVIIENVAIPGSLIDIIGLDIKKAGVLREYMYVNPGERFLVGDSKYRSKNKINIYSKDLDYRRITLDSYDDLLDLSTVWKLEKIGRFGKFSTPESDKFLEDFISLEKSDNLIPMGLFFKGRLVGWHLLCKTFNEGRYYVLAEQCYNRNTIPLDFEGDIGNYTGQILFYYMCKKLSGDGAKTVCIGTRDMSGKGVKAHKENIYKNIDIHYNLKVVDLDEQLCK